MTRSEDVLRRHELEGLRAVSALLVAFFHLWFYGLSGGVDVFFVVAGYFTTLSFFRRLDETDGIPAIGMWMDNLIRIAPNLALALLTIMAIIFLYYEPGARGAALKHVSASALFIENYYLVLQSAATSTSSPQQMAEHLWALSVIGQAYIVLPIILSCAVFLGRFDAQYARRLSVYLFALITTASFAYGYHATELSPETAYYNFFARLWQFTVGGLAAIAELSGRRAPSGAARIWSWLGLVLLVTCGFFVGRFAFPGVAALWPTLAAVLIIRFGHACDPNNAGRALEWRPLRRAGAYSYGFYIWHWPIAVPALYDANWGSVSWSAGLFVIALAFGVAVASEAAVRWVMRAQRLGNRKNKCLLLMGVLLGLAGVAYGLSQPRWA